MITAIISIYVYRKVIAKPAAPHYYSERGGISMTDFEAYQEYIQRKLFPADKFYKICYLFDRQ